MLSNEDIEMHLRDRLFYGFTKAIQDSIHYLYDDDKITCAELLIMCKKLRLKF